MEGVGRRVMKVRGEWARVGVGSETVMLCL
jgi:hypothetical protein